VNSKIKEDFKLNAEAENFKKVGILEWSKKWWKEYYRNDIKAAHNDITKYLKFFFTIDNNDSSIIAIKNMYSDYKRQSSEKNKLHKEKECLKKLENLNVEGITHIFNSIKKGKYQYYPKQLNDVWNDALFHDDPKNCTWMDALFHWKFAGRNFDYDEPVKPVDDTWVEVLFEKKKNFGEEDLEKIKLKKELFKQNKRYTLLYLHNNMANFDDDLYKLKFKTLVSNIFWKHVLLSPHRFPLFDQRVLIAYKLLKDKLLWTRGAPNDKSLYDDNKHGGYKYFILDTINKNKSISEQFVTLRKIDCALFAFEKYVIRKAFPQFVPISLELIDETLSKNSKSKEKKIMMK